MFPQANIRLVFWAFVIIHSRYQKTGIRLPSPSERFFDKQYVCPVAMQNKSIAGIDLLIRGPRSPVTDAVLEMFQLTRSVNLPEKVCLTTYDLRGAAGIDRVLPAWVCGALEDLTTSEEVKMVYGSAGDRAALFSNGQTRSCAWLSAGADQIRYVSCKMTSERIPLAVSSVLVPVLRELLTLRNRILLHAAALRNPDGTGLLLLADSGGGKTTTVLSMIRQGASFLGDDLSILQESGDRVVVSGFPELLTVTGETLDFFPELKEFVDRSNRQSISKKWIVSAQDIYGGSRMLDSCRLHVVYLVKKSADGPKAERLAPSAAFGKLIRAHTFAQSQSISNSSASSLFSILSRIPAFELYTGTNPEILANWVMKNSLNHRRLSTD